jgi:hypothetical protein
MPASTLGASAQGEPEPRPQGAQTQAWDVGNKKTCEPACWGTTLTDVFPVLLLGLGPRAFQDTFLPSRPSSKSTEVRAVVSCSTQYTQCPSLLVPVLKVGLWPDLSHLKTLEPWKHRTWGKPWTLGKTVLRTKTVTICMQITFKEETLLLTAKYAPPGSGQVSPFGLYLKCSAKTYNELIIHEAAQWVSQR